MRKRRSLGNNICLVLAVLFCVFSLTGCETTEKREETAETVVFTDALGRTVTVKKNPRRVAALIGSFADVWITAGGQICACAEDAWDDFGLDIKDAVNIGGAHSPNGELLLSAEPDFVIASASTASNVEMKEILENAKITVAYFDVDSFEDYLSMLDICTDITGRKDLFEQNGTRIKNQIEMIKKDFSDLNIPKEQRKVLLLRASSSSVKAKGGEGTVLGEMLSDMGCINIADSDKSLLENLSIESILAEEPYYIFVVTMGDDTQKARDNISEMIKENPAWNSLCAVSENRIYFMDRKLFNLKPNSRWGTAYEELCEILRK